MWKPGRQGSDHEVLNLPKILENWAIESPKQSSIFWDSGVTPRQHPGVPGIGEKTAKKLIAQFGSIEKLIANTDQLKGKQKENVIKFSEQALLSKQLATIILNVPVSESMDDFARQEPDEATLRALFERFEFRTLTKRSSRKPPNPRMTQRPSSKASKPSPTFPTTTTLSKLTKPSINSSPSS